MAGIDFLFKEGDMYFSPQTGDLEWTSTIAEALTERLNMRLKTWTGEWRYNTIYGTPYRRIIQGDFSLEEELKAEFKSVILEDDDVITVQFTKFVLDRGRRLLDMVIDVTTSDGQIEIPLASPTSTKNSYPEPRLSSDFSICVVTDEELENINTLHDSLYDLDSYEVNSWWKDWILVDTDKDLIDNTTDLG